MSRPLTKEERALLQEFAEWLFREHTVVIDWANDGTPSETYQRPEHMVRDFTEGIASR